jgi:AcrR family transcriptional regulator
VSRVSQSESGPSNAPEGGDSIAAIRSAVSRQAILNAARKLFSTRGYAATSIADIVASAGTSVGLPYYHFGSKKQIFLTLWSEYQISQEVQTRAAVAGARRAGARGEGLLLAGTRAYLQGAWEARDILPMVHGRDTPPGFDSMLREADRRWERQNRALLTGHEPELVATATALLSGALRALCLEFPKCRTQQDATKLIDDAMVLFAGLLGCLAKR